MSLLIPNKANNEHCDARDERLEWDWRELLYPLRGQKLNRLFNIG